MPTTIGATSTRPRQQQHNDIADMLRSGSRGPQVGELQSALNALGFNAGGTDGVFGKHTSDAVKAFQRANNLPADGIVGPDTRQALERARNTPAQQPTEEAPARQPADAGTVRGSRRRGAANEANARTRVEQQQTRGPDAVQQPPSHPTGSTPMRDITNRLDPEHNRRYLKHDGNTYCNVFTHDVLQARGVPARDNPQMLANDHNDWFHRQGAQHGWHQVSGEEAQRVVNNGGVGVVSRKNPGGHGHIAPIIEGTAQNGSPMISNAGSANFNAGPASQSAAFRQRGTEYWVYNP